MQDTAYEQRKQALIEEITAAFDGVSREDGVSLHETRVLDDNGDSDDRARARLQDSEARWQDVPDEDIRFFSEALNFLDPKGFRYYIPAHIVWFLHYMDNEDPDFWSNTFDSVIFNLTPSIYGEMYDFVVDSFKLLTPAQAKAVAEFLVFYAEMEDAADDIELRNKYAKRGLEDYWGQFLNP